MALFKLGMEIEFVHGASWQASTSGYLPSSFLSLSLSHFGRTAAVLVLLECLKMSLHIVQKFLTQFCCRNCLAGWREEGVPYGHAGTVTGYWVQLTYL